MAEDQQEAYNLADLEDFDICDYQRNKRNDDDEEEVEEQEEHQQQQQIKKYPSKKIYKKQMFHSYSFRNTGLLNQNTVNMQYSQIFNQEFNLNSLNNHFKKRSQKNSLIHPYDYFNHNDYYLQDKQKQQDFVDNQIFKKEDIGPWENQDRFKSYNQDAVNNFNPIQQTNFGNISNSNSMESIEKSKDSPQILDQNRVKQFILRTSHKQTKLGPEEDNHAQNNYIQFQQMEQQQKNRDIINLSSTRSFVKNEDECLNLINQPQIKQSKYKMIPIKSFLQKTTIRNTQQNHNDKINSQAQKVNGSTVYSLPQNVYKINYNSDKEFKTNQKLKESFANFLKEMTKQKLNQNLIQIDKIKEQNNIENNKFNGFILMSEYLASMNDSTQNNEQNFQNLDYYNHTSQIQLTEENNSDNSPGQFQQIQDISSQNQFIQQNNTNNFVRNKVCRSTNTSQRATTHSYSFSSNKDYAQQQQFLSFEKSPSYHTVLNKLENSQRFVSTSQSFRLPSNKLHEIAKIFLRKNLEQNQKMNKEKFDSNQNTQINLPIASKNQRQKNIASKQQQLEKPNTKHQMNIIDQFNAITGLPSFNNGEDKNEKKQDQVQLFPFFKNSKISVGNINLLRHNQQIKEKERKLKEQKDERDMQKFLKQIDKQNIHTNSYEAPPPACNSKIQFNNQHKSNSPELEIDQNFKIQGIKGICRQKVNTKSEYYLCKNGKSQHPKIKSTMSENLQNLQMQNNKDSFNNSNHNMQNYQTPIHNQNHSSIVPFSSTTNSHFYNSTKEEQKFSSSYIGFSQLLYQNQNKRYQQQHSYSPSHSQYHSPLKQEHSNKETLFFDYINIK